MSRHEARTLLALFALGWRRATIERATTFGRIVLLVLILMIFWAMWRATPLGELGETAPTVVQLFWYLAATETIAMSVGFPFRLVETEIHSGEIATALLRPSHYALATLANWLGDMTHRLLVVGTAGFVCGVWTTGVVPFDATTGIALFVGLWLAAAMLLISQLWIGLLATWMRSTAPVFWIWQKFMFVLGGLMIPLTLYPSWLEAIALATPFPAMFFLPAALVLDGSATRIAFMFAAQAFWIGLLVAVASFVFAKVNRHIAVNGI